MQVIEVIQVQSSLASLREKQTNNKQKEIENFDQKHSRSKSANYIYNIFLSSDISNLVKWVKDPISNSNRVENSHLYTVSVQKMIKNSKNEAWEMFKGKKLSKSPNHKFKTDSQ